MNHKLFYEAKKYIPGGVNSPVRSFKAIGTCPVFIKKAKGAKIFSEDGRSFLDYCQGYGALILGHARPEIVKQVKKTIEKGTCFGAPTKQETELARVISQAIPSMEKIRLTNSGTEAVMTAIRLSRAYTARARIIRFKGSYHGHADYLLDSKGVPEDFTKYTLTAPYNNAEEVSRLAQKHKKEIAAIIVEPVAGNMGIVLPGQGFLKALRKIADKHGIVLIFDEVITGFRLTYGGAQDLFNIKPDLTCLGKIIGGGFPIGAVGGKKEIMDLLAPQGPVYQAGTFSGNPVSVGAGICALRLLLKTGPYKKLSGLTQRLCEGMEIAARKNGFKIKINFIGPMFTIFFTDKDVIDYNSACGQDTALFKKLYLGLLNEGIYFSPSGFEANFLSCAHSAKNVEETLKALEKTFKDIRRN